jgi:phosphotransferase system enzyme I (PtsI)
MGTGIGQGVAIGEAVVWIRSAHRPAPLPAGPAANELSRLTFALEETQRQLNEIIRKIAHQIGETEAAVFKTHLTLLNDPLFLGKVRELIKRRGLSADAAVAQSVKLLATKLEALTTSRMRERAADLRDIGNRIVANLLGNHPSGAWGAITGILCAMDLMPSEISSLDPHRVSGIALEGGGTTSHTSILARALRIPMIVSVKGLLARIQNGNSLILDSGSGEVIIGANLETVELYRRRSETERQAHVRFNDAKALSAITLDGCRLEIGANIGHPDEIRAALAEGAEGIGLFRTEFLFLNREALPSEEEQFALYQAALLQMAPRRVIIRTADIGGDKALPFFKLPPESNPSLGLRAIRLALKEEAFFGTQIRALLRASAFGNLAILLPMVVDIAEVRQAKQIIRRLSVELQERGTKLAEKIPLGLMVETPAAALIAEVLAPEIDFFSIGTNDLTQYVLAADRLNEQVSHLYQPFHPAMLRLMHEVAKTSARQGKGLSVCGEMASDPIAAPLFVGLGVDELSMISSAIAPVKDVIRRMRKAEATDLVRELLGLQTGGEVVERLRRFISEGAGTIVHPNGVHS